MLTKITHLRHLKHLYKPNVLNHIRCMSSNLNSNWEYAKVKPETQTTQEKLVSNILNLIASPLHLIGMGLFTVPPQHIGVSTLFNKYTGKHYESGLNWFSHFVGFDCSEVYIGQQTMSLKESKIIDKKGNPVIISAVCNYHVDKPEQYIFGVDDPEEYIFNQSDKVLKQVVSQYTYDELRCEGDNIQTLLINKSQESLNVAGVKITDFSLTDMNYAPEIAKTMLAKQQASAYNEAKEEITMAAGDIVKNVINEFDEHLDNKAKAEMINNLLLVITSGSNVQPVMRVN